MMAHVGLLQMVSSADVQRNLDGLETWFQQAQQQRVQLMVLPENFAFMGRDEADKLRIAEQPGQGLIQQTIRQLAKRYGMWVIAGTIPLIASEKRVTASCLVYNDLGEEIARYDKIHLFNLRLSAGEMYQESLTIEPGNRVVVIDTPVGRVGLSVCYDLRFPELFQQMAFEGAEIFTVPSAFTAITGVAHWDVLLRARAIENLCYVLAPNQGGEHASGRETYGHSMVVEPWGKRVTQHAIGPGLLVADVDLQRLQTLRQQLPCSEHHVLSNFRPTNKKVN